MDAAEIVSSYHELWHARAVLPDEQARPASPLRLPPHSRRHRGPPDHGHGRPGRSPIPPGGHRDEHRQDRTRATWPTGGHHQHQRPPHQRRPTSNPQGRANSHRPEHSTPSTLSVMSQALRLKPARSGQRAAVQRDHADWPPAARCRDRCAAAPCVIYSDCWCLSEGEYSRLARFALGLESCTAGECLVTFQSQATSAMRFQRLLTEMLTA